MVTVKQPSRMKWLSAIADVLLLAGGSVISAVAVSVFMAPFEIAPGGVSGVAVILNHLDARLPIGLMVLIGNIPIQIVGFLTLGGWQVVAKTLLYVVIFSLVIDLVGPSLAAVNVGDNVLLNALFGGIIGGLGGGLVYRAGGTLGGTSTLARVLQQRMGVPLSTSALYTDTGVIVLAGLVFGWEGALYATVALFVGAAASDYVLEGPSVIRTATIITDKPEQVARAVMQEIRRGVTAWPGTGMFTDRQHTVLFVTVARPQVGRLRQIVFVADPEAFVVIGQGHVAYGKGFKPMR
ncbi:MAG: YitT family protein [Chloroflexi bacterium]|nr:YitT family protein [Chloroflexota bacterium]